MGYDPQKIEPKWQKYWLEQGTFRADVDPVKVADPPRGRVKHIAAAVSATLGSYHRVDPGFQTRS